MIQYVNYLYQKNFIRLCMSVSFCILINNKGIPDFNYWRKRTNHFLMAVIVNQEGNCTLAERPDTPEFSSQWQKGISKAWN